MFRHIVIIDKSSIIREGLAKIFNDRNISQKTTILNSPEEWFHIIKDISPEIIIINPTYIDSNLNKFKKKYNILSTTKLLGLIYSYFDNELLKKFDDNIYINEAPDIIINKIKNCKKENNHLDNNPEELLSQREEEILKLLIKGYSNKNVAEKLCLSVHTVTTHRRNIIEKTGIKSLSGLAVYAIINNISDISEIQ